MTREAYDMATITLDKVLKLKALKEKIKREIPELEYDAQLKEYGEYIFNYLNAEITGYERHFKDL